MKKLIESPLFNVVLFPNLLKDMSETKGRLRATIFESAETVHFIELCYSGDAIRCIVSVEIRWSLTTRDSRPFSEISTIKIRYGKLLRY